MTKCIVYGLYSSRDDELRYIGQTTQLPKFRLAQHRNSAKQKQTAVHKWFLREISEGFNVSLRVLVESSVFNVTEVELIALHKTNGARLLNLTDGGEGTVGWHGGKGKKRPDNSERNYRIRHLTAHPMSADNKKNLIAAVKARNTDYLVLRNKTNHPWIGKKHKPEWFEKMRGREVSKETREKLSHALRGRVFSEATLAKMRGHEVSAETREKIRAANSGKKMSDEVKKKIRRAMLGRVVSQETRAKISAVHKGKIVSVETRLKQSVARLAMLEQRRVASAEA